MISLYESWQGWPFGMKVGLGLAVGLRDLGSGLGISDSGCRFGDVGFISRLLQGNPKKELPRGLWVGLGFWVQTIAAAQRPSGGPAQCP